MCMQSVHLRRYVCSKQSVKGSVFFFLLNIKQSVIHFKKCLNNQFCKNFVGMEYALDEKKKTIEE